VLGRQGRPGGQAGQRGDRQAGCGQRDCGQRSGGQRGGGQRGSMTVEFVILAPLLLLLMLFLVFAGRVVEAHGEVDGAARDAARAASISLSPGVAQSSADQAVSADINGWCSAPVVDGFAPGSQAVTVTLHCTVPLSFVSGSVKVTGYAVAPLDQFVARTY
jgi:Flp pilus assembly protein TadG